MSLSNPSWCGCMHESFCGLKYHNEWKSRCPCLNCLVRIICLSLCIDRCELSDVFNDKGGIKVEDKS